MRTLRQARGAWAEDLAVEWLTSRAWRLLARNVKVGPKDEIDVVAIDPGPPRELVCVEVRSARSGAFGSPEERVDPRKVGNLYRAARAFARSDKTPQLGVGGMRVRVDLVVVDRRSGQTEIRHWRAVRSD